MLFHSVRQVLLTISPLSGIDLVTLLVGCLLSPVLTMG